MKIDRLQNSMALNHASRPQTYVHVPQNLPEIKSAWLVFIHEFADWTHAVTLTFRRHILGVTVSETIMVAALRHFLRVADVSIFGRRKADQGVTIPSVAVLGWGTYSDHPHTHLALQAPFGMPCTDFDKVIDTAASRTNWIAPQREIAPYRDAGWSKYMIDHQPENLVVDLLRGGRHASPAAANRQ